ncbi:MAG: CotH kinase family protein, partial [Eubacteriales bacterium]|nr:CotH kinase family protein [Eubacteriales bacterium]
MSTHKHIDRICLAALACSFALMIAFLCGEAMGVEPAVSAQGYEQKLFDTSRVHTIDIVMDDWDGFIAGCEDEEYAPCSVTIDGHQCGVVGIRAKGNTSLRSVSSMDSDRYSFKIEFDQYDNALSYFGLDKLCLNNLIQDATMMKDYITYRMMGEFDAAAPLCSYAYITVNGEDWGLYLAVESIEEAFLRRNFGADYGELYKPDSTEMGGGRGNGKDFDMEDFMAGRAEEQQEQPASFERDRQGGHGGGMSSSAALLRYIDDEPESYSEIFSSAKTEITSEDQERLIGALRSLGAGEALEETLDIDAVLRYFVVHNFVVNGDSYTGSMIHNYYLYEEDGRLSMLPWDYNLAFG